jgi:outer membrane receptor protein involved in Fe transport
MQKILIPLFILLTHFLNGQQRLEGKITDASGFPFEFCKVIVKKDSVVLNSQFTDSVGHFHFETLMADSVTLIIHTPYVTIDTLFELKQLTLFEYTIPKENLVDEVIIKATRPTIQYKVDRVIFSPENIPILAGGNAVDVLEFAPGIHISGGLITTSSGKTCQVLLNDKLIPLTGSALISFIYSIPTEDIHYIEIMEVIPIKFANSVTGALVHIKLKSGSKSRISNTSVQNTNEQGMYASEEAAVSYSYRKNKFSLYSNFAGEKFSYGHSINKEILYPNELWKEKTFNKESYGTYTGGLGINYECSKNTELGLLLVSNYGTTNDKNHTSTNSVNTLNTLIYTSENNSKSILNNNLNSVSFNLNHTFDTLMKQVSFIVDLSTKKGSNLLDFTSHFQQNLIDSITNRNNLSTNNARFISSGVDFVFPFNKIRISTGCRGSHSLTDNNLEVYDMLFSTPKLDTTFSNRFKFNENILASYVSLEKTIKKWSFLVAARGEYTQTVGNQITTNEKNIYNYLQINPQVFVMYRQRADLRWNFTYNRNFNRASFDELNPFKIYNTAYSFSTGNPKLKPIIFHSSRLTAHYKNTSVFLMINYSKDVSNYITSFDPVSKVQTSTISNFLTSIYSQLGISYKLLSSKRWSIDGTFFNNISAIKGDENVQITPITNFCSTIWLNAAYTLDKKKTFFIRTSIFYTTPSIRNYERQIEKPFYSLSLKKTFFNKRISMSFGVEDLFRIGNTNLSYTLNGIKSIESSYNDSQRVYFSFSYHFGNRDLEVNQKEAGSTGESQRYKK